MSQSELRQERRGWWLPGLRRRAPRQAPPVSPPAPRAHSDGDPARVFQPTDEGSGSFGRWILDDHGLPAYRYDLDQHADSRARYPNSEGRDRRDHWHQIGNDRVTALASNDGVIQVFLADRGGVFLNRVVPASGDAQPSLGDQGRLILRLLGLLLMVLRLLRRVVDFMDTATGAPLKRSPRIQPFGPIKAQQAQSRDVRARGVFLTEMPPGSQAIFRQPLSARHAFGGGYAYLHDGKEIWSTAYPYRPLNAETRRVFGLGYAETMTAHRGIAVTRRVYAPPGDAPFLLADVEVHNRGAAPVDLLYYEYWDVNVHQLKLQWVRTHPMSAAGDDERTAINELFRPHVVWDEAARALRFHQEPKEPVNPQAIDNVDVAPLDVFLADLSGLPDAYFTDKFAFFGRGGVRMPDAVRARATSLPNEDRADPMPCCLVLRRTLHLEAGQTAKLRFAFGALRADQSLENLAPFRAGDWLARTLRDWKARLPYFYTGSDPVLQREMAWHAYSLFSASVYNAYYRSHVIPQGSAYLYLHGADGVPRDLSLVILSMVYLRPALARELLRFLMMTQNRKTGALPYGYMGYGYQHGAVIHEAPSDLDLFFLWALVEYLAATGDQSLLDESVPFYPLDMDHLPPGAVGTTGMDHARAAVWHLLHEVGLGDYGLIKIGDGDWSDGVVFDNATYHGGARHSLAWFQNSKAHGESTMNTGMALYVLPRVAALLRDRDPVLAEHIEDFIGGLPQALERMWSGRWYTRAVLRNEKNIPVLIDNRQINLEGQVWALISGAAARAGHEAALIEAIDTLLDSPSPVGAPVVRAGQIWPAVSQLLTWGYTRSRPDLAWRSLNRQTFAAHATAYPDVWYNIWTGPDSTYAVGHAKAGWTWQSAATPMTDFPAMNSNPPALALLALLRVCGIEPTADGGGLLIDPHVPRERFTLDTALLRLEVEPGRIGGEYRAVATGERRLHIRVPVGAVAISTDVGGSPVEAGTDDEGRVVLRLNAVAGQALTFEARWTTDET